MPPSLTTEASLPSRALASLPPLRTPANPRANNEAGHVIRWRESRLPNAFTWEVFVFGAAADDADNHSGLNEMNQFASPMACGSTSVKTAKAFSGFRPTTAMKVLPSTPTTSYWPWCPRG